MKILGHGSNIFLLQIHFRMIKLTKTAILPNCAKWLYFCTTVNFIIQNWRFGKMFSFSVCQFFWWEVNLRGFRGNLKQINLAYAVLYSKPHKNGRRCLKSAAGVLIFVVILALLSKHPGSAHQLNENFGDGWLS